MSSRDLQRFYEGPLGAVACRFVGRVARATWPDLRGFTVVGLGFATPYLPEPGSERCDRVLAFTEEVAPAWPRRGANAQAQADLLTLPLPDMSAERVIAVHALETVENPSEFLHELWRILAPAGRALIVCPNRRGLWSRLDRTPFGHGQPYSRRQLKSLLRTTGLQPERWRETLYVPPFRSPLLLSGAGLWEQCGAALALPFAGLHVVEVSKMMQKPIPVRSRRVKRRPIPTFVPVPASRDRL